MNNDYQVEYYKNSNTGKEPVLEYLDALSEKVQAKIFSYIDLLLEKNGRLKHPYAHHIKDKIWELRIDFGRNYHRIFYFIFTSKRIVLLYAFSKKTNRIPRQELDKAINNYKDFISNN